MNFLFSSLLHPFPIIFSTLYEGEGRKKSLEMVVSEKIYSALPALRPQGHRRWHSDDQNRSGDLVNFLFSSMLHPFPIIFSTLYEGEGRKKSLEMVGVRRFTPRFLRFAHRVIVVDTPMIKIAPAIW